MGRRHRGTGITNTQALTYFVHAKKACHLHPKCTSYEPKQYNRSHKNREELYRLLQIFDPADSIFLWGRAGKHSFVLFINLNNVLEVVVSERFFSFTFSSIRHIRMLFSAWIFLSFGLRCVSSANLAPCTVHTILLVEERKTEKRREK